MKKFFMNEWNNENAGDTFDEMDTATMDELDIERYELFMLEIEQEEEARIHSGETADRKMLRRDIEKAAIARLEDAAETEADFWEVVSQWDRLDKNRERKERYHEVGRAEVPLEYGASAEEIIIPEPIGNNQWRSLMKGDFLEYVFECPFEMHELIEDYDISKIVNSLKDLQKELLFYSTLRGMTPQQIAKIREQTDRNIRKVIGTMLKKLRKETYQRLMERAESGEILCPRFVGFMKRYEADEEFS